MAKMRYEYLGIIHRNDLNILFKKGYIVLCTIHVKTISGNDSVPEEYIRELLKNVSPFDYTSEYVFIKFLRERKWLKRDCKNNIEYKEVQSIIPLDLVAKKDMEMSFNKMIKFVEPLWGTYVDDFSQSLFSENKCKGASACLEILGIKVEKPLKDLDDEDLIIKVTNYRFQKENLDENSSIWQYLLMYERHEPYPSNCLGYFYDSVHVFVNYTFKKEYLTMPKTEILKVLNLIDRQSRYDFEYIVCELKNNKCAERYIEKCTRKGIRQYILIPIYFYLLNLFSLPNYQSLMKDYCRNSFKRLYEKEYKLAVYLVGLRLGFDSINEIYYQKLEKDMESHQQSLF